jgi:anaerobic ribonucleoside-triphosphate reductase
MAIYKVKKRNGAIITFDRSKIENAIKKAIIAAEGDDFRKVISITDKIIELVEERK